MKARALDGLNAALRAVILWAVTNQPIKAFVGRFGMRLGAARFIPGETQDAVVAKLRDLEAHGFATNTAILGEGVTDRVAVDRVVADYLQLLDRLHAEGLGTNLSLKLTHLGLDIDETYAGDNLALLLVRAASLQNFIRIDMEESWRVDATLRIYRRMREAGRENVGTVLQSCLYRTDADAAVLLDLTPNLRLVKGAYREPASVAYPRKRDVDAAYVRIGEALLRGAGHVCFATHDQRIIDHVRVFAAREGIGRDRFEFQMLYGIRTGLQASLVAAGYKVLVCTPYGTEWYPFFMRRLAERPANLLFFLRSAVRR